MTRALLASLALVAAAPGVAAVAVPTCDATHPPPGCTDYFGVGNYANSPLPAGSITGFTVVFPGSGYTSPQVVITDPTGTGATATATVVGGAITSVTGSGTGYTMPQVTIVDRNCGGASQPVCGSGAMVTATLGAPFTGGMPKFVPTDTLPTIPVATPDTTTFTASGSVAAPDQLYVIGLVQYTQQLHSSLPPTTLRGYCQLTATSPAPGLLSYTTCAAGQPRYLGPIILAQKDRPVRVVFKNMLPGGAGGDLFLPVDTTYMGAGKDPNGVDYPQNRGTLHLHGGVPPWISDGTPHQWTASAGEATANPTATQRGVSTQMVPDMWFDASGNLITACAGSTTCAVAGATNDPGPGNMTFYWTNQQGGRLMFYHDHAYGITRLNVYAGEAAGYLLVDPAEEDALAAAGAPGTVGTTPDLPHLIPLVIQDKTFVPAQAQLMAQDPTWLQGGFGSGTALATTGVNGDLWFPHVYTTNQNPADPSGGNAFGRWDYGPWFFPPQSSLTAGPVTIPCTSSAFPGTTVQCPITPNPSGTPEGFMDTPVLNGMAYPVLNVDATAYRFQILAAGNDRSWNLSWFVADGTGKDVAMVPAVPPVTGATTLPLCTSITPITQPSLGIGLAMGALDPITGAPLNGTGLPMNAGNVPCWPNYGVGMPGIPTKQMMWAADGRTGGAPDPSRAGPAWIQIGTEGGLLPAPVVIPPTPVNYEYNTRSVTVTNVGVHGLWLGPAERADVIVDFSRFAGQTLILYNDGPAPAPGFDSRLDYFTGDGDQTPIGGAPSTQPGFGPNTRTILQVNVGAATGTPLNVNTLAAAFASTATAAGLFASTQPPIVVPESKYGPAYDQTLPDTLPAIQDTSITFTPLNATAPVTYAFGEKAIQELFTLDYGRMNATLGTEIPNTNFLNQTTVPMGYVDPPTEIVHDGETQFWKITHNGVDTHFIHFHLFNVQVVDRMGWDGSKRPPDANELGWKDTVRMNPLEDIVVALKPIKPKLPWPVPDSIRPMDVTMPIGPDPSFMGVDSNNLPITVTNALVNFGWEYVWHCHILGHEENDMMRPVVFQVPPDAPSSLLAVATSRGQTLTWTDNAASETGFTLQRATDLAFSQNVVTFPPFGASPGFGKTMTYNDTSAASGTGYFYRVQAFNDSAYNPAAYTSPQVPGATATLTSQWAYSVNTTGPVAAVAPPALAFGNQLLNTASAPQPVTVTNIGSAALAIASIAVSGSTFYPVTTTCPVGGTTSLASGASCTISVSFRPTVLGLQPASLIITDNSGGAPNAVQTVSLSGTGIAPIASVSPATLTFANTVVGTTSAAQVVTLSNATGTAPLAIASIGFTGTNPSDFTQSSNCGTTLAAGASCTISVTFKPLSAGGRSATLTVTDNSNGVTGSTQTVTVGGTGTAPNASITPTTLAFPNTAVGSASAANATLSNVGGTAPLAITGIAIGGTNASSFAQANNCGASLAIGASCTITVTFKPTAAASLAATLTVTDSDPVHPTLAVALSGTGTAPTNPLAQVTPTSLAFGSVQSGTTSTLPVTLANAGIATLNIAGIAIGGTNAADFSQSNGCGASLAGGASCTINVTFKPTVGGARSATLTITDNSNNVAGSTQTVSLTGTSLAPVAAVSPTALAFGKVAVGQTSIMKTVTVTNTGPAGSPALVISSVAIADATDYLLSGNCANASLASGASCTIGVQFTPKKKGGLNTTLTITDNSNGTAGSKQTVSITGQGQ